MKQALVIRHVAFEDLGSLASILEQRNYNITYIEAGSDSLSEISPQVPELLIILGGPIGAYDEVDYPFLKDEMQLLQKRLTADVPTLGICLGAQLIARALGSKVYPGGEKEIGWDSIELSHEGELSFLKYLQSTPVLHWHGDTFELPQGATHLASSKKYKNQAFVWGKSTLALQFHPEVTAIGLERWFIGHANEIQATPDISVTSLRKDTASYAQNLERLAGQFWQSWLESWEN